MGYPQTFKTIFRFSASTGRLTGIVHRMYSPIKIKINIQPWTSQTLW